MYKYLVFSNGLISKVEVDDVSYIYGVFVTLDCFPLEKEYFAILDGFISDIF